MSAYSTYQETCPYCNTTDCKADWCDVGVGLVQCGPFICQECGASSIGPYDKNDLTEEEKRTGWFRPEHCGTSTNTCRGVHVDHRTSRREIKHPMTNRYQIKLNNQTESFKIIDTSTLLGTEDFDHE